MSEPFAASQPGPPEILRALGGLRPGATLCPGELARRLGTTQAVLRPVLAEMSRRGLLTVTQRGAPADLAALRGPYRVALPRRG